jgi:hypothetical protein
MMYPAPCAPCLQAARLQDSDRQLVADLVRSLGDGIVGGCERGWVGAKRKICLPAICSRIAKYLRAAAVRNCLLFTPLFPSADSYLAQSGSGRRPAPEVRSLVAATAFDDFFRALVARDSSDASQG